MRFVTFWCEIGVGGHNKCLDQTKNYIETILPLFLSYKMQNNFKPDAILPNRCEGEKQINLNQSARTGQTFSVTMVIWIHFWCKSTSRIFQNLESRVLDDADDVCEDVPAKYGKVIVQLRSTTQMCWKNNL